MEHEEQDNRTIPKPDELLALYGVTTELFLILKRWFAVPDAVALDLSSVDAADRGDGRPGDDRGAGHAQAAGPAPRRHARA